MCILTPRPKDMETEQVSETLIYCHLFCLEICAAYLKLYFLYGLLRKLPKIGPEAKRSESITLTLPFVGEHQIYYVCLSAHPLLFPH
jgi:hypothetical protein